MVGSVVRFHAVLAPTRSTILCFATLEILVMLEIMG